MPKLRMKPHQFSTRPALIDGKQGKELFLNLKTRNCPHGKCAFCGLKDLDGEGTALAHIEGVGQTEYSISDYIESGGSIYDVRKVSLISNSNSVLDVNTISIRALKGILQMVKEELPNISQICFETRAEFITKDILVRTGQILDSIWDKPIKRQVVLGIESPYEEVRNAIGKELTHRALVHAVKEAKSAKFGLRGYFIYNLLEGFNSVERTKHLMDSIDLMASFSSPRLPVSMLILKGYAPEKLANTDLFTDFQDVPVRAALQELKEAALYAKNRNILFEIDTTTADQEMAGAPTKIEEKYMAALERYNTTLDPNQLSIGWRSLVGDAVETLAKLDPRRIFNILRD